MQEYGAQDDRFAFFPLIYNQDRQREMVYSFLASSEDLAREEKGPEDKLEPGLFWQECFFGLLNLLIQFKHPKFSEEKEWRLWILGVTEIKFRVAHSTIVPYVVVRVPKSLVSSVWLRPTFNVEFGRHSLEMFLGSHGLDFVVRISEIPLRSLYSA
jgi:hypothetical protein